MKRQLLWTLVILTACGGVDGDDRGVREESIPDSIRYGGTAVVGYLAEASSMNEFTSTDGNSDELQSFVLFTTLIQYDERLRAVPYLAESWDTASLPLESSNDESNAPMILTFRLRRDLKWHDGTPTTAYDVEFTLNRIKRLGADFPRAALFANYDSAVAQDSFTVALFLRRYPDYMDPWRFTSPMPRHILGDLSDAELAQHPFGTQSPVGNGPFRFVEHRPGDRWVFEAASEFPQTLGGRPYLDRLVYRVIEEPTTMLSELLTGELDVYQGIAPSQVAEVEESTDARVLSYASRVYAFINWNARKPLFADARVRRAMTLAIDRGRLVEAVRYGMGEVAYSPVPPYHWAHDHDLSPLPYDPERARALLDSAGWVDADGDGVRERDGEKASFELVTNPNAVREDILAIVQADLARVGVQVRASVREAQTLGADITGPERRFDAFVLGWISQFQHDDRQFFSCAQPEGPFQWAGYCNPDVDRLLDRVANLEDRAEALPLWYEYQEIVQRDQPYTFLYYEVMPNGVKERLRGVRMDIRGNLINAREWWILPESRRRPVAIDDR